MGDGEKRPAEHQIENGKGGCLGGEARNYLKEKVKANLQVTHQRDMQVLDPLSPYIQAKTRTMKKVWWI